ncbi:hypothetical protein [Celeribacter sp. SCSIO 80788]|uniref:hypothetical protein n=1 Tax=Celeribacter sp. SCSIO 80788 TaxID=3117013 RepID=UPI003DA61AE0
MRQRKAPTGSGAKRQVPAPVLAPPSGPTQPDVFARLAMAFSEGFQVGAAMRR